MIPEVQAKYDEFVRKYEEAKARLAALEAQAMTPEQHLVDFVMPERIQVIQETSIPVDTPLALKAILNEIPDYLLEECYDFDYGWDGAGANLVGRIPRIENDEEYNSRVRRLMNRHIDVSKKLHELELQKEIRATKREVTRLGSGINRLNPVGEMEERLQRYIATLPLEEQEKIWREVGKQEK